MPNLFASTNTNSLVLAAVCWWENQLLNQLPIYFPSDAPLVQLHEQEWNQEQLFG